MIRALRRVTSFLLTVVSALLLAGVAAAGIALVAVPKATDSKPLTVLTGSMRPTYPPGTVVIVRPTDTDTLKIGEVITFQPRSGDPSLTTHRIAGIAVTQGGREFVTRGDANGAVDPTPITPAQVRGAVWYSVPYVGYAANWVSGENARLAIDIGGGLLLLYALVQIGLAIRHRRRGRDVVLPQQASAAERETSQTDLPGQRVSPPDREAADRSSARRSPAA